MPLYFKDIYNRAINLFDDPIIMRAYMEDSIRWEKIMYTYLRNGISSFSNPTRVAYLLIAQNTPTGQVDVFDGDGTATYQVSPGFQPNDNADFSYVVNGQFDRGATYADGVVTFSKTVAVGERCSIEWYYAGDFPTDFSSAASPFVPASVIMSRVTDILAHALVLAWATNEKNFVLDIKNVLTDTDFKLYSPANSVRAKTEWVRQLQKDFDTQTTKLCWDVVSRRYHGGRYYG